ncbi:MAG: ferrous iron transport protein A [Planctomycetota bacterium]|jgi:Fe2+ transport system protein FeoA|nr:ferrous iron transport protein A [Planctomycetota bacterium]
MIMAKGTGMPAMRLSRAGAGFPRRIERITGPEAQVKRLTELGLVSGAEVSVLARGGTDTIVLKVGGSRLALASGMADNVWVK